MDTRRFCDTGLHLFRPSTVADARISPGLPLQSQYFAARFSSNSDLASACLIYEEMLVDRARAFTADIRLAISTEKEQLQASLDSVKKVLLPRLQQAVAMDCRSRGFGA